MSSTSSHVDSDVTTTSSPTTTTTTTASSSSSSVATTKRRNNIPNGGSNHSKARLLGGDGDDDDGIVKSNDSSNNSNSNSNINTGSSRSSKGNNSKNNLRRSSSSSSPIHSFCCCSLFCYCCHLSKVSTSRIIFIVCLIGVGSGLGYAAHQLVVDSQETLAREQFEAITESALENSVANMLRKRMGTVTLASIVSNQFPNVELWPNHIKMNGYVNIAQNIMATSNGKSMGILPLVTKDQLPQFEAFLYNDIIANNCPNGTAVHSFGIGVHGNDPSLNTTDNRYRETDGSTNWGSPYKIMTPYLYHSYGCNILSFNLHSYEVFGRVIDDVITCSNERANILKQEQETSTTTTTEGDSTTTTTNIECSTVSDILFLYGNNAAYKSSPAAVVIQTIYPENNNTNLVGIISSTIEWSDVLVNVFSGDVDGIDCVLETDTQAYTYSVNGGIATTKGEGDLHDRDFSEYGQSIVLNGPGIFSTYSATYKLTLYPNHELFEKYYTTSPFVMTAGTVMILIFISCLFFMYDRFVRQAIHHKRDILKAKRQHVRFISHEVRTPLNAVCMGLQLLHCEIERFIIRQQQQQQQQQQKLQEKQFQQDNSTTTTTEYGVDDEYNNNNNNLFDELHDWSNLSEDILSNTNNAVDVLNDLLNYDKIETGTLVLELGMVSIWSLIDRTASEFVLQARQKNVHFKWSFDSHTKKSKKDEGSNAPGAGGDGDDDGIIEEPRDVEIGIGSRGWPVEEVDHLKVVGDSVRITQVLRNLISNGLKFTPEDGHLIVETSWKESTRATRGQYFEPQKRTFTLQEGGMVECEQRGTLCVSVTDTGAGMSQDQLKKLFGKGVQFNVNKLQAGQGSGLGLYIAKGIVDEHGGSLTVTSKGLGLGTTFTMTLPLYEEIFPTPTNGSIDSTENGLAPPRIPSTGSLQACALNSNSIPESSSSAMLENKFPAIYDPNASWSEGNMPQQQSIYPKEHLRVLVVDDSPINRKLLCRLLQNQGHECVQAEDGAQAVQKVKDVLQSMANTAAASTTTAVGTVVDALSSPDVVFDTILMDFEMPNMNGPEAVDAIRRLGCESFIVGITGNMFPEDITRFKKCGANKVLPKPLHLQNLEEIWIEYGLIHSSPTSSLKLSSSSRH